MVLSGEREDKILYYEGDKLRVYRGILESEDQHFIRLKRRDGIVRIAKTSVVKIQQRTSSHDED
jgi:predicted transcriptional regulator